MIPLMMESGYKPNGWLGLILGCKLWFSFHHEAVETDATFTTQMDLVERELAGRGQPTTRSTASRVSEGVPPSLEPEPEPAPAPAPAASARAPAPAPAPAARLTLRPAPAPAPAPPTSAGAGSIVARPAIDDRSMSGFSPSVAGGDSFSRNTEMIPQQASSNATSEVSALIIEQLREQAQEIGRLRAEAAAVERSSRAREKKEGVSDEQLAALQARLAALHDAQLLNEDELNVLEDLCADFAELQSMSALDLRDRALVDAASRLRRLAGLSEKMPGDKAFARQAIRKFVSQ